MEVLVVCAHPQEDSFTHAVAAAARAGFERAGHDVTTLDLYAIDFVLPCRWRSDGRTTATNRWSTR